MTVGRSEEIELWCYRRTMKISCLQEKVYNETDFKIIRETPCLLDKTQRILQVNTMFVMTALAKEVRKFSAWV